MHPFHPQPILFLTIWAAVSDASVTCRSVGASATAAWTDSAGKKCTWTGVVGVNFGKASGGGDYSCNGRCGAGCTGTALGNVYTQDCWTHDICSWFENASGGASDPNCGAAFTAAIDDFALGLLYGCGQTNPSLPAMIPSSAPVCV